MDEETTMTCNSLTGFDRDRFTSEVDDEFICSICLGVLRRPVQLTCEHMFCHNCIDRWRQDNQACPNCRHFINETGRLSPPSRALMSLLNKLTLYCCFRSLGCNETVSLSSIIKHERNCGYQPVKCPIKRCSKQIPKMALARHINECQVETATCPNCELNLVDMSSHSKDDCILELKKALKKCVDIILEFNHNKSEEKAKQSIETNDNTASSTLTRQPTAPLTIMAELIEEPVSPPSNTYETSSDLIPEFVSSSFARSSFAESNNPYRRFVVYFRIEIPP